MFTSDLLDGQVAVVTGAARGLGFAITESLLAAGAHVVMTDLDPDNLTDAKETLESAGLDVSAQQLDVVDAAKVEEVFQSVVDQHGRLDILVNNAGMVRKKPLLDHTADDWRIQLAVNLDGTFYCAQTAARHMTAAGKGAIVNIAAVTAFHYTVEHAAYAAAKAGVVAFTRDLAYEIGPAGVRVNGVAPGFIKTPLLSLTLDEAKFSHIFRLGRWGEPEDIARAVTFLASDAASFITGVTIPVAGGCDLRVTHEQ